MIIRSNYRLKGAQMALNQPAACDENRQLRKDYEERGNGHQGKNHWNVEI
jgi:hypothetical protein